MEASTCSSPPPAMKLEGTESESPRSPHGEESGGSRERKPFGELERTASTIKPKYERSTAQKSLMMEMPTPGQTSMVEMYRDTGWAAKIAKHRYFELTAFSMIVANAAWIGLDAEKNTADLLLEAHPVFIVGENLFCLYFFSEWVIRIWAAKDICTAMSDSWFVFDTVLVLLMVCETWVLTLVLLLLGDTGSSPNTAILSILSLLRLSRMARMARLLRSNPELLIMVKGLLAAMKSVMITMGMQLAIIYIFGIAMKLLASDTDAGDRYFSSVFRSMYSLALHATLLDGPALVLQSLGKDRPWAAVVFFFVILLSSLLLLNMLIGVLCEVVSNVSSVEKEQLAVKMAKEKVMAVFEDCGLSFSGLISKNELLNVIGNENANEHLREAGVDVIGLKEFADVVFQSDTVGRSFEKQLSMADFMKLVLQLRGTNTATVKDIVDLRKYLHTGRTENNKQLERIEERLWHMERLVLGEAAAQSSTNPTPRDPVPQSGARKTELQGAHPGAAAWAGNQQSATLTSPSPPSPSLDPPRLLQELRDEAAASQDHRLPLVQEVELLRARLEEKQAKIQKLLPAWEGGSLPRVGTVPPPALAEQAAAHGPGRPQAEQLEDGVRKAHVSSSDQKRSLPHAVEDGTESLDVDLGLPLAPQPHRH